MPLHIDKAALDAKAEGAGAPVEIIGDCDRLSRYPYDRVRFGPQPKAPSRRLNMIDVSLPKTS